MKSASSQVKENRSLIRPCDLSDRVQAGLRSGFRDNGYRSERTMLFALVLSAVHQGFTFPDVSNSFRTGTLECRAVTQWQVRGGHHRADRELQKLYDTAVDRISAGGDRQHGTADAAALRAAVEVLALPGRGGPSERAVLIAIADAGVVQGRATPRVSRLELSIGTGRSNSVVEGALSRLLRRGYLSQIDPGRFDRRAQWSITKAAVTASRRGALMNPEAESQAHPDLVPSPAADVWAALGLVAWEVLRLLSTVGPHSASDAADVLGRNPYVVRRHLKRLAEDHQLVEYDSDRVWTARIGPDALVLAARRCGAEGASLEHEQRMRSKATAGRAWLDQRELAIWQEARFRQVRKDYLASSFLGSTPAGGLIFVCLDVDGLTYSAWKAAGCPLDYREVLPAPCRLRPGSAEAGRSEFGKTHLSKFSSTSPSGGGPGSRSTAPTIWSAHSKPPA